MAWQATKRGFSVALLLGLLSTIGAVANGYPWTNSASLALIGLFGLIITNMLESEIKNEQD